MTYDDFVAKKIPDVVENQALADAIVEETGEIISKMKI